MTSAQDIPLHTIQQYKSLRASVTEALRTAIIVGDLEEGRLYSAPALAEPLGVSATPVREAMMDLAGEGLVISVKNKGFRVTVMTPRDLEEMAEVRTLLEAPVVRDLAGTIPAADYASLHRLADEVTAAAEAGDLRTYLSGDRKFHADLLRCSGNTLLVELATRLRGQTRLKALRPLAEAGVLVDSAREHTQLLELMEAGDAAGTYDLIVTHIGHVSRLWAQGVGSEPAETPAASTTSETTAALMEGPGSGSG
ncbi:GntR family transcriptional regulator [Pseudactinotalea sp. Z1748]|uniref:GntR family transcriptional regulator n=1 Tax=Pseudactinotalea sp. Z1748 TaxID=3413027 RepID=UPI003C7A3F20